jgi:hypothetical protein
MGSSRDCLHSQLGRSQQQIGRQGTVHLKQMIEMKKSSLIDMKFVKIVALRMPMNGLKLMESPRCDLGHAGPDSRHGSS